MKKLIAYALPVVMLLTGIAPARSQQSTHNFNALNDTLIARYNRGDFKGMYALESKDLQAKDPEQGFVDYFAGLAKETGKIVSPSTIAQKQNHHYFLWTGEKKNERFDIVGFTPTVMDDYFISDFLIQPNARKTPVKSDNPLKSRLDSAVQRAATIYMSDPLTTGLSIGIWQNGKCYYYNYGEIKKRSGILPTQNNVYNTGSIAKTFVGTLLAEAVVEGKIKLDDDIRNYLPGSYPNLQYNGQPVRVVNLANHTSALPNSAVSMSPKLQDSLKQLPDSARLVYLANFYRPFNADSMLRKMHGFKVDTLPGTRYHYNGTAVSVLILLLERVYHQPYEQLLQRYLGQHLHMYQTSSLFTTTNLPRLPQGYNSKGEAMPTPSFNLSQFVTSPSINSTASDMLTYIQANLEETDPAVKLTHQVTFSDKQGNTIGINWMLDKDDDGMPRIFHSGQTGYGYTSLCTIYPEQRTGYIIFVNDMISQSRLSDLEQEIRNDMK